MEKADKNHRETLSEPAPSNVCPVSGLPILRKPEWTDISFGTDYMANVSMIGNSILLSRSKGRARRQDVENLFRLNSDILAEEMNGKPYVYIEDFSNLKGASLQARKKYIENIKKREQIRGVVYYGLSPLLKMSVKLGKHINVVKFDVKIADDYPQAVRLALDMLQGGEIKADDSPAGHEYQAVSLPGKKGKRYDILSHPDWNLQLDGYSVGIDVIDGRIIHSFSTGYMEEKHIEPIKIRRRKAYDAMCPETGFEYFIAGVSDLKGGSRRARKLYMESLKEWHRYRPFRMYIIYGSNRFMRTAANLARPFMPFKVRSAEDLDSALKLINEEEVKRAETNDRRKAGFYEKKTSLPSKTQQYVDELLQYLGAVNWEIEGVDYDYNVEIDPAHPFKAVFEALGFIKAELNQLLGEHRNSEERLKESEKRYRELVNSLPQIVFETDVKGNITFVNRNAFDLFAYTQDDFDKGLHAVQMIIPGDRDRATENMCRVMNGESFGGIEYTAQREDGSTFPCVIHSDRIVNEDKPVGLRGMIIDLTERKKAEDELRESEDRYRDLVEHSRDLICTHDLKGNILSVNQRAIDIMGYDRSAFLTKNFKDLLPYEFRDGFDTYIEEIQKESVAKGLIQVKTKTGERRIWEYDNTLRTQGVPVPIIRGMAHDITDRVTAEKALQNSERFMNDVFESIRDGICVLDTDLTVRRANSVLKRWHKKDLPLEGKKCHSGFRKSNKPCDSCPTLLCLQSGQTEREIVPGLPGSPIKWLEIYSFPMKDRRSGKITGVVEFLRDITETKNLELQLRQSQKMEAIGTLAGGIAHDFNNLLTAIMGNADLGLIKAGKDNPEREGLLEIKKAAQRAASLTSQLLAFSRKQVIQPKVLDINEGLSDMEKMLKRLIGEDIELRTLLESGLGKVHIDPGQIDQIVMNLVVNARDAMPQGGKLTIETANVNLDEDYFQNRGMENQPGPYVMLAVSDTGKGMNEDTKSKIFDPFFTTKEQGKGTGLGLSTVYGIVKQNNGYVWVYSEPEGGSAFKIYLPRLEGDGKQEIKTPALSEDLSGSEVVLVVEDDNMVLDLAQDSQTQGLQGAWRERSERGHASN